MNVFDKMGIEYARGMTLSDLGLLGSQRPASPLGSSPRAESYAKGARDIHQHILTVIRGEIAREVGLLQYKQLAIGIEGERGLAEQNGRILALRELGGLLQTIGDEDVPAA